MREGGGRGGGGGVSWLTRSVRLHLEPHHEGAWCTLPAVKEAGPFEPDINIVQAKVLPLGLAFPYQPAQLPNILPCCDAMLLILCLLCLVDLGGECPLL